MRYTPDHKSKTRHRILRAAANLFRRRGYHGVGIERIMAAAKLTRGGFYGHFRSKADLFAAVLAGEHDFNRRMRERPGTTTAELRRSALDVASGYLAPQNHDKVGPNCAMASLSVDVARGGATARRAYTDKTNEMLAEFSRGIDGPDNTDPRAVRALALCVGGLIVARALDDNGLKHAFADACLDGVRRELETPS